MPTGRVLNGRLSLDPIMLQSTLLLFSVVARLRNAELQLIQTPWGCVVQQIFNTANNLTLEKTCSRIALVTVYINSSVLNEIAAPTKDKGIYFTESKSVSDCTPMVLGMAQVQAWHEAKPHCTAAKYRIF
ncbi:hypothetical protein WN51_07989 [Melipona quadrifasciata]|uniref:Uncharacterized protein n=1 Tax=Melipona quadrifasciata TaxID=166423 RepID=A0A0M8ZQH2_9HYME|nr:hypothetical protein WN51_07989 [Melipona quadrifasciata]